MILIIPIVLLVLTAGLILLIRLTRPGFPALWLLAVTGTLIAWLSMIFLRLRLPSSLTLFNWASVDLFSSSPALLLDYSSWPYAFAITSVVFCIVLVSPGHLKSRSEVINLSGSMALGGLSLLAVFASNPTTLLLGWAAMDLVELFIFMRISRENIHIEHALQIFSTRVAGLIIAFWSFVLGSREAGFNTSFTDISPQVGLFLLISIGLRVGVFPIHLPYISESSIRRGQGTILRMAPAASSLVVLSRLPSTTISSGAEVWLSILAVIALVYSAIRWLVERDELHSRPFFLISMSSFAIITVLMRSPFQSSTWGISLIYLGGMIFLLDSFTPFMKIITLVGVLGLIGLPFTPNASGVMALFGGGNIPWLIVGGLSMILILFGYISKVLEKPMIAPNQEQIIYLVYPLAMIVLVLGYYFTGLFGWPGSRLVGAWWFTIPVGLIMVGLWIWNKRSGRIDAIREWYQSTAPESADQTQSLVKRIINLEWIFSGFRFTFRILGRIASFLDNLLEGQGGFLWAALVFVLFLAILQIGSR